MSDFPAAHSMDTDWFAVDADGNVGIFNSSEGGAVPNFNGDFFRATRIDDVEDFCKLLPSDEKGIIHLNTEAQSLIQYIIIGTIPKSIYDDYSYEMLMIISSEEVIDKLKNSDNFILRFAGEPVIIYVNQVSNEIINSMFSSGEILGATEFELFMHPHCLGLFFYDNYGQVPIPYEREGVPATPLKVEDLSEELQQALSKSNFEKIRFTETEIIQPIEYTACNTWDDNGFWVDSRGNERQGFDVL
ncbi:hypothetical protein Riv7116_2090 [Rivularia sp. PCC 7116]|uniref:hypothetical protein n=1 Tax=Rivularia sp. PCC 7116 TaxID=373994 RepID=UPI00029F4372|nr:hypothetical protein [Rivularia sp. PCC 7116]AFY54622.1 hypothetical protein Riv7116_2090 [Rivularia sp. PCC 7116]